MMQGEGDTRCQSKRNSDHGEFDSTSAEEDSRRKGQRKGQGQRRWKRETEISIFIVFLLLEPRCKDQTAHL